MPLWSSPVETHDGRLLPSHGPKLVRWAERNIRLGRGDYYGQPLRLTSFQKRWLWRQYEYWPETGHRRYKRTLLGTGKGNGKTPFEATVGGIELMGPTAPDDPLVLVAAAALDQSDLVFADLSIGVSHEDSPLADAVLPYALSLQLVDRPGEAKRVAAAQGSNDGPRATCFLADELHEWLGRLWDTFTILDGSIGKRQDAFELMISTAGSDKRTLLGENYDRGVAIAKGELVQDDFLFEWYEIPDELAESMPEVINGPEDEARWREAVLWANPALAEADYLRWEYVRSRFDGAQLIPRYQWMRYHGNRWTRAEALWLPPGTWHDCRVARGEPDRLSPIFLAFAGTYNGDSAGLVGVTPDHHVFVLAGWEPPEGPAGATYRVPRTEVDAAVDRAFTDFRVQRFVVNPNGWQGEYAAWMERWTDDLVVEFDWQRQVKRKADASSKFYTDVAFRRLTHDGDPRLARHLESAAVIETKEGSYITRESRNADPVELAVAAVMAHDQATSAPPEPQRKHAGAFRSM